MKDAKVVNLNQKVNTIKRLERMFKNELRTLSGIPEVKGLKPTDLMMQIMFEGGHVHGVYPDDEVAKELTRNAVETLDMVSVREVQNEKQLIPTKVILHNRQAIGDILMFTCAVRDFKAAYPEVKIKVQSTAMHLWDYNPNLEPAQWPSIPIDPVEENRGDAKPTPSEIQKWTRELIPKAIEQDRPIKLYIGPSKATNASNRTGLHFANGYRQSIEEMLGIDIPQGPIRPDVYMSEKEYKEKPLVEPPYWLITAGEKGDWTCKTFYQHRWQEVVSALPDIKFVQLGAKGHPHPELKGRNVVNFIGETQGKYDGIRRLFNLFNYCEGSMGLVSFQMHLAAAFGKPCVVVAGAREPVSFTRYNGHQYLSSDGCLPCSLDNQGAPGACWFCKIERCPETDDEFGQKVPRCVHIIKTEEVVRAVQKYYEGGRLHETRPLGRSTVVNVVGGGNIVGPQHGHIESKPSPYKLFPFDNTAITRPDWEFIEATIDEFKIKTVLEFGAGLSTLLMNEKGLKTFTYEIDDKVIEAVKLYLKNPELAEFSTWDRKEIGEHEKFDMAFVDAPAGGENREWSTMHCARLADIVLAHDAGRPAEMKWAAKYLEPTFRGPFKGGSRTHRWQRMPKVEAIDGAKVFRLVFNGRGEGGAERSTTWLMNKFIEKGWVVEYVSPNGKQSGTFRHSGDPRVDFFGDLSRLRTDCDILCVYTNDWVWDFPKDDVQKAFYEAEAKRKVLITNFRLGKIGEVNWTRAFDKYLFLNSSLEKGLKSRLPWANTKAIAPATDLTDFLKMEPDYGGNLRIVRVSSQGDTKYPKDFGEMIAEVLTAIPNSVIHLMPPPTFIQDQDFLQEFGEERRIIFHKRNQPSVPEFLALGNVFWYKLPENYEDQGPKVIMEAQAVGLPVVADNHSGAKDRLSKQEGYLCNNFQEHLTALQLLDDEEKRKVLGISNKHWAEENYTPENWYNEIVGKEL